MVFQMPNLQFSCCNLSSVLLVLSLVEMPKSCFSALLLPFPYLKVVIISNQSSLNLNKPNSFPGRSCFLDLITFFLWSLSSSSFLKLQCSSCRFALLNKAEGKSHGPVTFQALRENLPSANLELVGFYSHLLVIVLMFIKSLLDSWSHCFYITETKMMWFKN